ncbi:MAG: hypothetical protein ACFB14_01615 [Leptolyngbyaceae cyanobacterium]
MLSSIVSGSIFTLCLPALANSVTLDISIENQAVGSFLDPTDSEIPQQVESNVVNEVELKQPTGTSNNLTDITSSEPTNSTYNQIDNTSEKTVQ